MCIQVYIKYLALLELSSTRTIRCSFPQKLQSRGSHHRKLGLGSRRLVINAYMYVVAVVCAVVVLQDLRTSASSHFATANASRDHIIILQRYMYLTLPVRIIPQAFQYCGFRLCGEQRLFVVKGDLTQHKYLGTCTSWDHQMFILNRLLRHDDQPR